MALFDLAQAVPESLVAKILKPESDAYKESLASYYAAIESELQPAYIVQPTTAQEVSELVKALDPRKTGSSYAVAVRGGGHAPVAGSANADKGVTIDLSNLRGVALSADKSSVRIAGGEKWGAVYEELKPHGLTAAGGRVGDVGVAGLTLGGGLSYYSTKRGFVCDNVLNFEVALASGDIVNANASENSDLWWALRGGSSNFGIVTRFDFAVFEGGDLWGGLVFYQASEFPAQLGLLHEYALHENNDELSQVSCSVGHGYGYTACTNMIYHTQGDSEAPAVKPFVSVEKQIENMGTMRSAHHKSYADEITKLSPKGQRTNYFTTSIKPDLDLMTRVYEKWQVTLNQMKDVPGLVYSIVYQPITTALLEHSEASGGNALGLSRADTPFFILCVKAIWGEAKDDERVVNTERALINDIDQESVKMGLTFNYKFLNYAYEDQQPIDGYGEANKRKLLEISEKYDPKRFFQKVVSGGFKLV